VVQPKASSIGARIKQKKEAEKNGEVAGEEASA